MERGLRSHIGPSSFLFRIKMKTNKKILFVSLFLTAILIVSHICSSFYSKEELESELHFVVAKVENTPLLKTRLYDKSGNKLSLHSYTFFSFYKIQAGDSIAKDANSPMLNIFRKNDDGAYRQFLMLNQAN